MRPIDLPASLAIRVSQYLTGMEERRFISDAVVGLHCSIRATFAGPPSLSKISEMVSIVASDTPSASPSQHDLWGTLAHVPTMRESAAARLKEARIAADFAYASDAAKRFGWKLTTYQAHETAQNGFGLEMCLEYARAYKVDPAWLAWGITSASRENGATETPAPDEVRLPREALLAAIAQILLAVQAPGTNEARARSFAEAALELARLLQETPEDGFDAALARFGALLISRLSGPK